jgi:DNA-binding response OmpR family regulator
VTTTQTNDGAVLAHILVVDDDRDLVMIIEEVLLREQHSFEVCYNGIDGYKQLQQGNYDVVLLDWDMPGMSGIEVCRKYRASGGQTPVLMLTAKNKVDEKEFGLDAGSDDYLGKPFATRELAARIRALIRRQNKGFQKSLTLGSIEMDTNSRKVYKNGREVILTQKEYALLEFLMLRPGEMISQDAILQRIWGFDSDVSNVTLRTVVSRIRQKLDDSDDEQKSIIEATRRVGYRIRTE